MTEVVVLINLEVRRDGHLDPIECPNSPREIRVGILDRKTLETRGGWGERSRLVESGSLYTPTTEGSKGAERLTTTSLLAAAFRFRTLVSSDGALRA